MAWKATGQPTVRKQRDKWVVRVDGIDTATGKHRPKQVGTYLSQRSAQAAARKIRSENVSVERGTVGWLVHRWVASKTNLTVKPRERDRADSGIDVRRGPLVLLPRFHRDARLRLHPPVHQPADRAAFDGHVLGADLPCCGLRGSLRQIGADLFSDGACRSLCRCRRRARPTCRAACGRSVDRSLSMPSRTPTC